MPNPDLPIVVEDHSDKVYHSGAYFFLFLLWFTFFKNRYFSSQQFDYKYGLKDIFRYNRSVALGAAALCFLIGIIIELAQGYLSSSRSMDFYDVVANTVGILFAALFLIAITYFWLGTEKSKAF